MPKKGGSGAYYQRLNFSLANELNACGNEILTLHHGFGIYSIAIIFQICFQILNILSTLVY